MLMLLLSFQMDWIAFVEECLDGTSIKAIASDYQTVLFEPRWEDWRKLQSSGVPKNNNIVGDFFSRKITYQNSNFNRFYWFPIEK